MIPTEGRKNEVTHCIKFIANSVKVYDIIFFQTIF